MAIAVFFVVPVAAALLMSATDFDIYALADLRNVRFVGLDNYLQLLQTAAVLASAAQHPLLRGGRRPALHRGVAGDGAPAPLPPGALQGLLPHRAVRAGGDHPRGGGGGLGLPAAHPLRPAQLRPVVAGPASGGLARRPALGDAGDRAALGVEELRLQHGHPARGPAGDPGRAVRGRAAGRRRAGASSGTSPCPRWRPCC